MSRGRVTLVSLAAVALLGAAVGDARGPLYQGDPSSSKGGRYVAFDSENLYLVAGGTTGVENVFVRDRVAGVTELVSVSRASMPNQRSSSASISADGRYIAFGSNAPNGVAEDTNGESDVFVRDRVAGTMELISVSSEGKQGNRGSSDPTISADGRFVAFSSYAFNLVPDDENSSDDVFLRDRTAQTTELVSVRSDEEQGNDFSYLPSVSADGRYVAFSSYASNLVAEDANGSTDIFVRDRVAGTTELVSVSDSESQANGLSEAASISADGRYVAFLSDASNLVPGDSNRQTDVFVRDRTAGATELVSLSSSGTQGNESSRSPSLSYDGRYVAFESTASDLVSGDTNSLADVFVRDRLSATTRRVSISSRGNQANNRSEDASISGNGRIVAFTSWASNLAPDVSDSSRDTFVRDLVAGITEQVSVPTTFARAGGLILQPAAPRAGRRLRATLAITQGGKPVVSATISCSASIGGRRVPVTGRSFRNGTARCTWTLPSTTTGKTLRGRVEATTPNGPAGRTFQTRVT